MSASWSLATDTTTSTTATTTTTTTATTSNLTNLTTTTTTVLVYTLVWPQFIYSSICLFGATTVSINISVFANKKLTDRTYQFLLVEAIVDLLYITMMGCSSLINCGTPCQSRSQTLWAQIIRFCFYEYLTSCFAINNILIEVFLSLERLCVISNRQILQKCNFKPVIIGIASFSLAYYTPVLFMKQFVTEDDGITYRLVLTSFGKSRAGRLFPGILSFVRLVLATIVLFSINMTTFVKFKRHVKKKSKLKGNFQSKPGRLFFNF